jgi:hypothetical protein
MREDGETLPQPSTLDDLRNDPAMKGAVAFLAEVAVPEKTVRFNITARESQLLEIDGRARAERLTRSAYMVHSSLAGRKGAGKKAGAARLRSASRVSSRRQKSA